MPYIILIICLAIALALQFLTGNFPVEIMAFPLNVICMLLWAGLMSLVWINCRKSMFVRFMISRGATLSSILLLTLFCLVIGITGKRHLAESWVSVFLILYFLTVLMFVIMSRWRSKTATGARLGAVRWRFLLIHSGLFIALASAFFGASDKETLRLQASRNIPVRQAFRADGTSEWLSYELILNEFRTEKYSNGAPSSYEGILTVNGKDVDLRVNRPYSLAFGEELYLVSGSTDGNTCILQIVREPWKYVTSAGIFILLAGAFLLFAGGPRKRYADDM